MENKVDHGPVNEETPECRRNCCANDKANASPLRENGFNENRIVEDGLREQCVHEQE